MSAREVDVTVWIVQISHRHGEDLILEGTERKALDELNDYACSWWGVLDDAPELDEDQWSASEEYRDKIREDYFKRMDGSESYTGPDPRAVTVHLPKTGRTGRS